MILMCCASVYCTNPHVALSQTRVRLCDRNNCIHNTSADVLCNPDVRNHPLLALLMDSLQLVSLMTAVLLNPACAIGITIICVYAD